MVSVVGLAVRDIFSAAALQQIECDWRVTVQDHASGITVSHQLSPDNSGELRFNGGPLGETIVKAACDVRHINLVATLIIDGIRAQSLNLA